MPHRRTLGSKSEAEASRWSIIHCGHQAIKGCGIRQCRSVPEWRREAGFQCFGILKASRAEPGRRIEHLRKGNPAEVITRFVAEERIDAVVMGTVVRLGLPGFLIGNTAETVLDRVSCSLFTVKPEGFVSPVTLPPEQDPSGQGESRGIGAD
jgi:hypothetical protein